MRVSTLYVLGRTTALIGLSPAVAAWALLDRNAPSRCVRVFRLALPSWPILHGAVFPPNLRIANCSMSIARIIRQPEAPAGSDSSVGRAASIVLLVELHGLNGPMRPC
jgi:hypothetical protein